MPNDNGGPAPAGTLAAVAVLVTGAASGIGLAVAARCLAEGAAVAALDRDGPALARAVAGLAADGPDRVTAVQADVADPEQVRAAVATAGERLGRLTAVVNVAGIGGYTGDIGQTGLAEWARTLAVNLSGTFHVCRAALPLLRAGGGGGALGQAAGRDGQADAGGGAGDEHPYGGEETCVGRAAVIARHALRLWVHKGRLSRTDRLDSDRGHGHGYGRASPLARHKRRSQRHNDPVAIALGSVRGENQALY